MATVQAITRSVRMSPMKVRQVARVIVGQSAAHALDVLKFIPRKSARFIEKTLKSAIANAENNHNLSSAELVVSEAHVDDAAVLKRFMPAARGSAKPIRKRSSHIRITLTDAVKPEATKKVAKKKTAAKEETK